MNQNITYYETNEKVAIPGKLFKLHFKEKEGSTLNDFQFYLVRNIGRGYDIKEIALAMNLSDKLIENELIQMVKQNIMSIEDGRYCLTNIAKGLLKLREIVNKVNASNEVICVNLITGELMDERYYCEEVEENICCLKEKIMDRDLDGIGVEENQEYFLKNIEWLNELSEDEQEFIFSAVFIEIHGGKKVWFQKNIVRVPRVFINTNNKGEGIVIGGKLLRYYCKVGTEEHVIYVDTYSGDTYLNKFSIKKLNKRVQWQLPERLADNNDLREKVLFEMHKKHNSNSCEEIEIHIEDCNELFYKIEYPLDLLLNTEENNNL